MEQKKYTKKRTYKVKRTVTEERTMTEIEDVEGYRNLKVPIKNRLNNGNFITLFQEALNDIILNGKLSKGEMKLLLYLIANANPFGAVNLTLNDLVNDLKEHKSHLVTFIKGLTERNIVIKKVDNGARIKGKLNYYELSLTYDRLNYNLAWKGKVKDYKQVQHKDPKVLEQQKALPIFNQPELPFNP
jgi:hypothetical protein